MFEAAIELQTESDVYKVADVQDLGFIEDGTFDLTVSYLKQCDLPDFDANNSEVYRVRGTPDNTHRFWLILGRVRAAFCIYR
jgi:hypothetical protein